MERGRLTTYAKEERPKKNLLHIAGMLRVHTTDQLTEDKMFLKKDDKCQKRMVCEKELRRYEESAKKKQQNNEAITSNQYESKKGKKTLKLYQKLCLIK